MRTSVIFSIPMLLVSVLGCSAITTAEAGAPADTPRADIGIPAVGSVHVMRVTDHQKKSMQEVTWTAVEATYPNRQVYGMSNGTDIYLYDKGTRNWIATFRGDTLLASASPEEGTFSWPLEVGKSWTASYSYYDGISRRSWNPIVAYWKVVAYEDVTVPAGTFKAFRLESSPGTNNAVELTVWYAPDVKLIVKRTSERMSNHYLGYGKFTTELVRMEK